MLLLLGLLPHLALLPFRLTSHPAPLPGALHQHAGPAMLAKNEADQEEKAGRGLVSSAVESVGSGIFGADEISIGAGSRVYLVGADIKRDRYKTLESTWTVDDSMKELRRLCETAGLEVCGSEHQNMQHPNPSTYIGSGKVVALADTTRERGVEAVVFDEELTPAQQRNLQEALGGKADVAEGSKVRVIYRTMLILQIFAQRARTREAKLQVEAARLRYMMPRLTTFMTTGAGMDSKGGGSGGKGGGGLKGAGETQLEMDKRLFRKQIGKIEADMEVVRGQREVYRSKRRERDHLPVIAIVGYTNAGKSSLLNKLAGEGQVYADNLLFATLDPTVRKIKLPGGKEVLLTDTVGFIQKLPTKLVNAFRSTLEELEDADLVLHIVDASHPLGKQQVWSVQNIIHELAAGSKPQILVLNKADAVLAQTESLPDGDEWLGIHDQVDPKVSVATSALHGQGLNRLMQLIERELLELSSKVECMLPYSAGDLLHEIHKTGTVVTEAYVEAGTRVVAYVPPSLAGRLQRYACTASENT